MSASTPSFKTITGNQNVRLRGTLHQTDGGLSWVNGSYKDHNGLALKLEGATCAGFSLQNNSGSTAVVGLGYRIPNKYWIAGQWTAVGPVFTNDTANAQETTSGDFALETTTNNDGYVVMSRVPFNCVAFNVTTASVDATDPVRAVRYSDAVGTAWIAMTITELLVSDGISAAGEYAAGENLLVFSKPNNWGRTTVLAGLEDFPGYYAVNVQATTAPDTTAGLAGAIELWNFPYIKRGVVDAATLEFLPAEPFLFEYADAVQALFGTLAGDNLVFAQLRNR